MEVVWYNLLKRVGYTTSLDTSSFSGVIRKRIRSFEVPSVTRSAKEFTGNCFGWQLQNKVTFDGDISSFWHTDPATEPGQPHRIIVDIKEIYKISALRFKVRKGAFLSGKVKEINVYGRPDCLPYKKKAFRCKNDAECA